MKRSFIFLLVLFVLLSPTALAQEPIISVEDGMLVIESPANGYANLIFPFTLEDEPEELMAEMKIQVEGSVGSSWGPGLCLYWDADQWIMIRNTGNVFRMEGLIEGVWTREEKWPVVPSYGWNGLRLVWKRDLVEVHISSGDDKWRQLGYVARPGKGMPWLLIGKGFGEGKGAYPKPYLANAYSDLGPLGVIRIKDVILKADGKAILEERFTGDKFDEDIWVPVVMGDPDLNDKIKSLNTKKAGAVEDTDQMAFMIDADEIFQLSRWEMWRDKVQRPAALYKDELLDRAKYNIRKNLLSKGELAKLKESVKLVMGYNEEQIAHMIPDITPTCHLFTPSPLSDLGFPHGSWTWSPEKPDQIICKGSGRVFPNEDFPEDIVLVVNFKGKEQRLTFHRSKDWVFGSFPLATSFTGNIRAQKINYMYAQLEKLGIIYGLTGEEAYAKQARLILLRFAEVYPYYLVHSGYHEFTDVDPLVAALNIYNLPKPEIVVAPNTPNYQLHAGYWMAGRATSVGMEGTFLLAVANAYDLVADAKDSKGNPIFTEEEKIKIERDLLLEGTKLLLCDEAINNKTVSARAAVAAVGAVVGDPLLVRWGYEGFNRVVDSWFLSDGATPESPAYALMSLNSLWKTGEIFHGYSDPVGYKDESGHRFDNLNIYREPRYQAVWQNMYLSMLPDTKYPPIADSYVTSTLSNELVELMALRFDLPEFKSLLKMRASSSNPSLFYRDLSVNLKRVPSLSLTDVLFPDWRLAYLRSGANGMTSAAILNMSDWGGHHHFDSLNLVYWKEKNECLSDLGYLWDSPQSSMTTRTVAHNLVVVDESNQRGSGRGGDVHLFHPLGRFKVMEGSSQAYFQTSLYRRAVAQVEHPRANSYLVDVFRVKGGNTHDFVFHGPSRTFSTKGITLKNDGTSLSTYQFTNVRGGSSDNWSTRWASTNGYFQTIALAMKDEKVLVADGWGQRATTDPYTTLPFVIRRRSGTNLESCFVYIYEGFKSKEMVTDAKLLDLNGSQTGAAKAVGVAVNAGSYNDYILSAMGDDVVVGDTKHGRLSFQGASGIASFNDKKELEILGIIDGIEIKIGEWGLIIKDAPLKGDIDSLHDDGFSIEGEYPELAGYVGWNIFTTNFKMQSAYPIRKVDIKDGCTRIYTQDETGGFPFAYYAGTWHLPQVAYLERLQKNEYLLKGTGSIEIRLPKDMVGKNLAYHTGDGKWKTISTLDSDGSVTFTLSLGGSELYLRLK